jgi:WD40 repeat protein
MLATIPKAVSRWQAILALSIAMVLSCSKPNQPAAATAQSKPTAFLGHKDFVHALAFSPDGELLASGSDDMTIKLWNLASGRELATLKAPNSVRSLTFSPDSQLLASGTLASGMLDNTIKIWDIAGRKARPDQDRFITPVEAVAFSPDGKTLICGGNELTVWDPATGKMKTTLGGHVAIKSVAFSTDGKLLASAGIDGQSGKDSIKLWDVGLGRSTADLRGHSAMILCLAFSPDGKTLASGGADNTARLWSVSAGKEISSLHGHTGWVNCLAFSPTGKTLVTGAVEMKWWDVAGSKELPGPVSGQPPQALAFSPDGRKLAVSSCGGFFTRIDIFDVSQ